MSKPLYTASECKQRIRAIDQRLAELRELPSSQSTGPHSFSVQGKIESLQKQRNQWERRLERAREYEETGSTSGVNGPDSIVT